MKQQIRGDECILFQIAKLNQAAAKFWADWISKLGVTAAQGMVLNFLCDEDQITSKELGIRIRLDSATLTGILDRLEILGKISREKNPEDRRSVLICLTRSGRKTGAEIKELTVISNKEFLKDMKPAEQKQLLKYLQILSEQK